MVDLVIHLPISRSWGSPSAATQQRIRTRTHVQATGQPPPPRSSESAEAATPSRRKATGNMYLANPRPWGNNSRGGERSFTRRCVDGGNGWPFIGGGGCPLSPWPAHGGVTPHLPHSCGGNPSTLKCLFTFPFKVSTLNALSFSKFNALSFNKTLLLNLFRILLITLINKHSHITPCNISISHAEPPSAISPETISGFYWNNSCALQFFRLKHMCSKMVSGNS